MLACGGAIDVGVRALVAILRKLMQLHMVEHDLEISFLRHCFNIICLDTVIQFEVCRLAFKFELSM